MKYKLATYGTLKRGGHNHYLLKDAKFLGEGYTEKGYGLIVDGLPFLVQDKEGPGCYIELYEINDRELAACDALENHPNFYFRKEITVYDLENNYEHTAYTYIYPHKNELRELGGKLRFIRRF